jgi:hypothetical protein
MSGESGGSNLINEGYSTPVALNFTLASDIEGTDIIGSGTIPGGTVWDSDHCGNWVRLTR